MAYIEESEIDVVDYIKVLVKRRWVILIITLLFFIAANLYALTQSPSPEKYQAKTSLLIIPSLGNFDPKPNYSVDAYQILASAQDIKEKLSKKLQSKQPESNMLSISALDNMMETVVISKSPTILIDFIFSSTNVTSIDPVYAVNTWADLFVKESQELSSNEAGGSFSYISEQYRLAKDNLTALEDSLVIFERTNRIEALEVEAGNKNAKLVEYHTGLIDAQAEMDTLLNTKNIVSNFLKAMETDTGKWVGSPDVYVTKPRVNNITDTNRHIFNLVVQARDQLRNLKEKVQSFELEHDLKYKTQILESQKARLLTFKNGLVLTGIDASVIEQILKNQSTPRATASSSISAASEQGIREILSLQMGVNLFQPRQEQLLSAIQQEKASSDSLSAVLLDKQKQLSYLTQDLPLLEHAYQVYKDQYLSKKKQSYDLVLTIQSLQQKIAYYTLEIQSLRSRFHNLTDRIADVNRQKMRMMRNMETYKATFNKFTQLYEDTRIAKAVQPRSVRMVARAVVPVPLPNDQRSINTLLVVVVGFLVSVLLSFFLEYWEKAKAKIDQEG